MFKCQMFGVNYYCQLLKYNPYFPPEQLLLSMGHCPGLARG